MSRLCLITLKSNTLTGTFHTDIDSGGKTYRCNGKRTEISVIHCKGELEYGWQMLWTHTCDSIHHIHADIIVGFRASAFGHCLLHSRSTERTRLCREHVSGTGGKVPDKDIQKARSSLSDMGSAAQRATVHQRNH